jgi:hypothetical protein
MSERLEYFGNPLPTGLPGFGGGTVNVLALPGFNRVVAAQKFGPVNDAPTVTPPDPTPPAGSNPENPTNEVVAPAAPPTSGASANFCERCVPPNAEDQGSPLLFSGVVESGCTDCQGFKPGTIAGPRTASDGEGAGTFLYGGVGGLEGNNVSNWKLDSSQPRARLNLDGGEMSFISGGGPSMTGPDGQEYKPEDLEVCEGGQTKTWKVLAYKP